MTCSHYKNCKRYKYLLKRNKCPVACYPNSTKTSSVVMESDDIEKNPGPSQVNKAPSCVKCELVIRSNAKRCICISCSSLTQQKCGNFPRINKIHPISILTKPLLVLNVNWLFDQTQKDASA